MVILVPAAQESEARVNSVSPLFFRVVPSFEPLQRTPEERLLQLLNTIRNLEKRWSSSRSSQPSSPLTTTSPKTSPAWGSFRASVGRRRT